MNEQKKTYIAGLSSAASFTTRVLIIAAIVALSLIVWRLSHVIILVFAGIVLALMLRALAEPLARFARLPHRWALATVVTALIGLVVLAAWLFGERIGQQFDQLLARIPEAWARVRGWLEQDQLGRYILDSFTTTFIGADKTPGAFTRLMTSTFGAIADVAIIVVVGIYLAAEPIVYRRGLVKLVPPGARDRVNIALDAVVHALKRWLLGQGLAMLAIGVMTGLGLWALGIPMALALAILAGVLEFVPYIGPFCAAIPAVLIALAQNPIDALYVIILYCAIQEFEGWALIPLIEKWAVRLPPVLTILSVVIFGYLFGVPGIIVAAPLMIVVIILVRKLYIEGLLGEKA